MFTSVAALALLQFCCCCGNFLLTVTILLASLTTSALLAAAGCGWLLEPSTILRVIRSCLSCRFYSFESWPTICAMSCGLWLAISFTAELNKANSSTFNSGVFRVSKIIASMN